MCTTCEQFGFDFHSGPNTMDNMTTDKDRPATFQELVGKQGMITDAMIKKLYSTDGSVWSSAPTKAGVVALYNDQTKYDFMFDGRMIAYNLTKVVDTEIKGIAVQTFKDLQSFLNVSFFESSTDSNDPRTIEFIEHTDASRTSYARVPSNDSRVVNLHGDGKGATISTKLDTDSVVWATSTIKHEIGHTLGLSHPGIYDRADANIASRPPQWNPLESDLDNKANSIMSYDNIGLANTAQFQEFDIIALQAIYGESKGFEDACKSLFLQGTENARTVEEGVALMEANLLAAFTPEFRNQVVKDLKAYIDWTKCSLQESFKVVANVVVDNASNEYLDDRLEVQVIQLIAQDNSYLINNGFGG